jgi:hypothetical protein
VIRRPLALSLLLLLASAAPSWAATTAPPLSTASAVTRFVFEPALLESFGLEIESSSGNFEFEAVVPSSFVVDAAGRDFEGISGGSLRHVDGFTVRFRDLRISPQLAAELGRPDFAGIAIARVELEAETTTGATASPDGGLDCDPPVWTGVVDVELVNIAAVQQRERASGEVVVSPSARLRNVGTADIPWYRKFEGSFPPYDNDQHAYLIYALYRIAPVAGASGATAIEMLGQSGLKHAVYATNQDCWCAGGHILYAPIGGSHDTVACSDVYGTASNDDSSAAGPREDGFEAHTGIWSSTGSYFDQDSDGDCDWDTGGTPDCDYDRGWVDDGHHRRMYILEADLSTSSATYYIDSWYLVRGDVDVFNSMGWRQVLPSFSSPSWSFAFPGGTSLATGSVLDAWVPRSAPPAGASHQRVDTGVGELSLAARTTSLGGGDYRYEYALANHDFDRKVQSVRIPFPPGTAISNAVFRGLGNDGGSDWTISIGADAITFQAPANEDSNSLDYGTLFSFGFEADVAPAAGSVDLGALEETPSLRFASPATTPGGAKGSAIFFDDFESGGSARWSPSG